MAKVDLSKATTSNWQQLAKAAITDAKSRCGKANVWNGAEELKTIKEYFFAVRGMQASETDGTTTTNQKREQTLKNLYWTIFDAVSEANLEIVGTDCW